MTTTTVTPPTLAPRLLPMLRRPLLAALSLLVVGASAWQVRTTVTLDVADDGSGTVEVAVDLDAEAVARLPDLDGDGVSDAADLAALERADDLVAAGWTVEGPRPATTAACGCRPPGPSARPPRPTGCWPS